ncbi:MAG: tRNA uridine-5-carboxymethylaminomethyl(34) synthesis GTPase MnmE [Pseudomonadota bacterium]
MNNKDTICAIVTPPGTGGVGIVRISGGKAQEVLQKIWQGKVKVANFESHKMHLGHIQDPQSKNPVDNVLVVIMRAPHSYTGEDVVEISGHGGQMLLGRILASCQKAGARLAQPGEFTRRAFLNGKMDLAQAEAVADLIAANNESAARLALNQLEGKLSETISSLQEGLTNLRAFVEAAIDFPEEDIEFIKKEGVAEKLKVIASKLQTLISTYADGRLLKDGVKVAIIGKPNVGKSSLFNKLVGSARAIVHYSPGTTRDLVSETIQLEGVAFHLIDAAGIRDEGHEVEMIGIELAREQVKKADLIIRVVDEPKVEELKGLDLQKTILCLNKIDLLTSEQKTSYLKNLGTDWYAVVSVSALEGKGLSDLQKALSLFAVSGKNKGSQEGVVITSARHKQALKEAVVNISEAIKAVKENSSAEFIAEHLTQASGALGQIIGQVSTDDILNQIFSKFCIGK